MLKTVLYRAAVLALLVRIDSTLTELVKSVRVLRVLADHPLTVLVPDNLPPEQIRKIAEHYRAASQRGDTVVRPVPSFDASRSETAVGEAQPRDTRGTGRWTPTSGPLTADERSRRRRQELEDVRKTWSPTEASSPGVGSPGVAPASSGSIPSHDHEPRLQCIPSCPAWFAVQRDKIVASGHAAICMPSLRYPMSDCNDHPHVAGAPVLPS